MGSGIMPGSISVLYPVPVVELLPNYSYYRTTGMQEAGTCPPGHRLIGLKVVSPVYRTCRVMTGEP